MFVLVMKSLVLIAVTFGIFALIGWKIAGVGSTEAKNKPHTDIKPAPKRDAIKSSEIDQDEVIYGQIENVEKKSMLIYATVDELESKIKSAGEPEKPELLATPKGEQDDLKEISGIGPVNEKELNDLGVFHYWQIAKWTPENIIWIAEHIRFPKRIVQENWMAQAARLMKNG